MFALKSREKRVISWPGPQRPGPYPPMWRFACTLIWNMPRSRLQTVIFISWLWQDWMRYCPVWRRREKKLIPSWKPVRVRTWWVFPMSLFMTVLKRKRRDSIRRPISWFPTIMSVQMTVPVSSILPLPSVKMTEESVEKTI